MRLEGGRGLSLQNGVVPREDGHLQGLEGVTLTGQGVVCWAVRSSKEHVMDWCGTLGAAGRGTAAAGLRVALRTLPSARWAPGSRSAQRARVVTWSVLGHVVGPSKLRQVCMELVWLKRSLSTGTPGMARLS